LARNACFSGVWSNNCPIIAPVMLILALDTSSPSGSIAVLRDEKVIGVMATATDETYSSRMFRQLEFLLAELKISLAEFDLFAVNSGPGSFTGLRVGLTAAKGWAEVYGKPAIGVSGLEAVAAQSHAGGAIVPVLDARRGQVYFGFYRRELGRSVREAEDRVATPEEFAAALKERPGTVVTPDLQFVAQIALRSDGDANAREEVSGLLAPVIGRIAYERARRGETTDALTLDANYVRRSDAELFWKGS
jgi:tRNA threonylcarbamoyladenosine biosynthesis protein TsaB